MDDFASICETIAAMLSQLPAKIAPSLDGAEPLTDRWVSVHRDASVFFNPRTDPVMPSDLSHGVHVATIGDVWDCTRPHFVGLGLRTATLSDIRSAGRLPFVSTERALFVTIAMLRTFAPSRESAQMFASWHPKERRWIQWGSGFSSKTQHECEQEDFSIKVGMALSVQFTRRYYWHVKLGYPQARARLALATNATEARKLFAARDLPEGKQRRAALRHWVAEHYRRAREVEVRSHFRGAERFNWDGMQCEITPSEYDRDRVGALPSEV
jgi:hypothetical protein